MEETHQKKIEDLQRQHQRELEKLREEKDRLLAEETAATISGGSWHSGWVSQRAGQGEDSQSWWYSSQLGLLFVLSFD